MTMPLSISSQKSTTDRVSIEPAGRIQPLRFPGWLRNGFQGVARVAPQAAAKIAWRLFFTPLRARRTEAEDRVLDQAARFTLSTRFGTVQGYSWGRGPAVLLIHGWGGHAGQMTALVADLVARGFRAIALDMPSHGESPGRMSSLVHFSVALESAGEVLGPIHAVAAHSFGAAATAHALARTLRVDRVVFFAPPSHFESFWRRFRDGLGMAMPVWTRMVRMAEDWIGVRFADIQPRLLAPEQTVPLLVLHDRGDSQVLFEEGAELAALWPGARFVETRGLGHLRILRDRGCIGEMMEFVSAS
ncbi:MAG: alpha/beta fold hydrolase [Acidobacteriota bacterium]